MKRLQAIYREYPRQFWLLMGASFIDSIGGALLFPFFSLYFTQKFNIGMTKVGVVFSLFAMGAVAGNAIGGALTDKFGRKRVVIFSLVTSALSNLAIGLVNDFTLIYGLAALIGVLNSSGGPARQAMVADLLPEHQRADGYGLLRVNHNLAVMLGPMIGGFLAGISYLLLFVIDTIASLTTALVVYLLLRETIAASTSIARQKQSIVATFRGYTVVFRDVVFIAFALITLVTEIVYFQMNSSLAVYLRDFHTVSTQQFGFIISLNAGMVVVLQFWFTRRISGYPPLLMMAVATVFYAVGFGMYGFVAGYGLFLTAMAVITIGEMVAAPVGQSLVALFAPEDMRGRYMAVYALSFIVPTGIAPLLAGFILDNSDADLLWYLCLLLGLVAAGGFTLLHRYKAQTEATVAPIVPVDVPV